MDVRNLPIRDWPYPYRCGLAICSDLDETPDWQTYSRIAEFLNGNSATSMGVGLGLEVGNTLYFDMPPSQFAYWNTDDAGRAMAVALMQSGHIDCFHSFGDLALTRADALRSLDELARRNCKLGVWVDHAVAVSNLGADIMQGSGDVLDSPAYHADRTIAQGVRYVWRGRVTSTVGQNARRQWSRTLNRRHWSASAKTLAKEAVKVVAGKSGSVKYGIHAANTLTQDVQLRDGQRVTEFIRCNPHWLGTGKGDTSAEFGDLISARVLDTLESSGGVSVLYTHLGKVANPLRPFDADTVAAFRGLADRFHDGRVFVATTYRLLEFLRARASVQASLTSDGAHQWIDIRKSVPDIDLSGLSIQVPGLPVKVRVDGVEVDHVKVDRPNATDVWISFPWRRLAWPDF